MTTADLATTIPSLSRSTASGASALRARLALAASIGVLGAFGAAASGASAASTVHHAYGNGPFAAADCTKNLPGDQFVTYRLCIKHQGTQVTAGYTISAPSVPETHVSFRWSIVGRAYTPGSPDRTYESFFARDANKPGYNVSAWVVRGGVPANVCAAVARGGQTGPRRNGSGKAC